MSEAVVESAATSCGGGPDGDVTADWRVELCDPLGAAAGLDSRYLLLNAGVERTAVRVDTGVGERWQCRRSWWGHEREPINRVDKLGVEEGRGWRKLADAIFDLHAQ